jgi:type I restriction enzyme S subunit
MELKQGYKQTEVGVIPEDWKIEILNDLTTRIGDGIHSTPKYSNNGEYYFVNGNNLVNGKIIVSNDTKKVSNEEYHYHKRELNDSTILISINGTIGNIALYGNENILIGKSAAYLNLNNKIKKLFLYQVLQSKFINRYFENELTGSTIKNLGLGVIRNTPIPLPTLPEQTAIANALSDMDALISQTEKLIEKKKAIKQGAMQELLKPKEGWVTKKFTDVVNYIHGKAHEQFIVENGKYEVVNSKFISTEGTVKKYADVSFLTAKKGDVLTVLSDLPNGKALAKCFHVEEDNKYAVNQRICIWRSTSVYPKFLFYFLNRHKYFMALNDGVSQTHILNGHIEKFYIEIPENYSEQQSIAETLWDMDKELQLIETKLNKLKQQKQGMMQALLTGKIRLVS